MSEHSATLLIALGELFGPSLEATLDARVAQLEAGHTSEADDSRPTGCLLDVAARLIADTRELVQPGAYRNLPVAERRLARAAAVLLAAFDRVRRERLELEAEEQGSPHA